jgi:hypothetical protein
LIFDRLFHILKKKSFRAPAYPINVFALVIGAETTCFKFQASYDRLQATSRNDTQRDDTYHNDTKNNDPQHYNTQYRVLLCRVTLRRVPSSYLNDECLVLLSLVSWCAIMKC